MERWMISCDFTILQAPPSDGNVSVHATKAAKSVVGVSHRFTICESKFGSLRLKSLGLCDFATHLVQFVQCILSS